MHFDFSPLFRALFRPRPSAGGVLKEKRRPGALVFGSRKASLLETWLLLLAFSGTLLLPEGGSPLHIMIIIPNFRETFEIKFYFRKLEKNFRERFQHNMHGFRN